jgi:hypothetical protein
VHRSTTFAAFLVLSVAAAGCDECRDRIVDDEEMPLSYAAALSETDGNDDTDGLEDAPPPVRSREPDSGNPRYALLIACSKYDYLGPSAELRGPVNDVVMMSELLTKNFGFAERNITVLSENAGHKSDRPLRAHIEREFKRLAERAAEGARVVVFFSGHGAQLPDDNPGDPADPEPDGLDEILCAADIRPDTKSDKPNVLNAVRDDDLNRWLQAIRAKGASVWVIIDACHSGTAIRGTEVYRQLPPEMLVSQQALQRARRTAGATRGVQSEASPLDFDREDQGGIVAIYAAQPHEPTVELPLPLDADDGEWHGLLTYTLSKVLTESAAPITYTELVQRIHREYIASCGRLGPVPLVEGTDQNREVLGTTEWPDRSRLVLQSDARGRSKLNAGRLHGLTPGTILAVFPPAGEATTDKPLGYVRITRARMTDADAEACEFNEVAALADVPDGARCRIERTEYGDLRLRVAIDDPASSAPDAKHPDWREQLEKRAAQEGSVFELVDAPATAQWLVRVHEADRIVLVPAQGWALPPNEGSRARFGPAPIDEKLADWLTEQLSRIARASNLLKLAGVMTEERERGLLSLLFGKKTATTLNVDFLKLDSAEDEHGKPIEWKAGGVQLQEGDIVAVRLKNTSEHAVDFTILFVDSAYGIEALYPPPRTVVDNRLEPGKSYTVGPLQVDADSVGLEHLIIIALKADGPPVDFSWLAQNSVAQARSLVSQRGTANSDQPLNQLFQQALFAQGKTRGLKMSESAGVSVRAISWKSVAEK